MGRKKKIVKEVNYNYELWTKEQLYDRIEELTIKSIKHKFYSEERREIELEKCAVRKELRKFDYI